MGVGGGMVAVIVDSGKEESRLVARVGRVEERGVV